MKNSLTPYKELDDVLTSHAEALHRLLGSTMVGYYLQGSLAIGDFDQTSDIDFVIVTSDELTDSQVKGVQLLHTQLMSQDNRWVKRLEYSFFPIQKIVEPASPYDEHSIDSLEARKLWYFDNGHKEIEKSDHCNTLVTRWTIREKGITVLGQDPKVFIPVISPDKLRAEIKQTMVGWGNEILKDPSAYENRFYQSYLVLNFSRMLQDLHEGIITSKLEGAEWAKQHLDAKWADLIDFCWQERQDEHIHISQPASKRYPQVIEYVRYIVGHANAFRIK